MPAQYSAGRFIYIIIKRKHLEFSFFAGHFNPGGLKNTEYSVCYSAHNVVQYSSLIFTCFKKSRLKCLNTIALSKNAWLR